MFQELYVKKGFSTRQISKQILCSKSTVDKYLNLYDIVPRVKSQHHGNPAQPRYGQKRRKNGVIEHKAELRAIKAIFQMHEEGLSLRGIAKCLTEMKIPTKCRGKSWHPEMVKRIINKNGK